MQSEPNVVAMLNKLFVHNWNILRKFRSDNQWVRGFVPQGYKTDVFGALSFISQINQNVGLSNNGFKMRILDACSKNESLNAAHIGEWALLSIHNAFCGCTTRDELTCQLLEELRVVCRRLFAQLEEAQTATSIIHSRAIRELSGCSDELLG